MLVSYKYTASRYPAFFFLHIFIISAFLIAARPSISSVFGDQLPRAGSRLVALHDVLGSAAIGRSGKNSTGQSVGSFFGFQVLLYTQLRRGLFVHNDNDHPSQFPLLGSLSIRSPPVGAFTFSRR
jgi:hypothetical protein